MLTPEGYLSVLEGLYGALGLARGRQRLVYWDGGAPGPVAYCFANDTGGYDLPARAYTDDRFAFALAASLQPRFRPGVDVSLPTPWTENVRRYAPRLGPQRAYFLTFKGSFATSKPYGDVRSRAAAALHDPANGVIIVDAASDEGKLYDYDRLMFDTVFTLVLRGDQPYSYRYTEARNLFYLNLHSFPFPFSHSRAAAPPQAVCSGAVPVVVLSDGWVLPFASLRPFDDFGVLASEGELSTLVARLRGLSLGEARVSAVVDLGRRRSGCRLR